MSAYHEATDRALRIFCLQGTDKEILRQGLYCAVFGNMTMKQRLSLFAELEYRGIIDSAEMENLL